MSDLFESNEHKEVIIPATDIEVVPEKSVFWDINKSKKRGAFFNFITGVRGVGKTYGALLDGYHDWLAHGWTTMYLRRKQNEGAPGMLFAKHIANGDIKELIKYDKGIYWICRGSTQDTIAAETDLKDWEAFCYTAAISTSHKKKSNAYINCNLIILDEFISEVKDAFSGQPDYLPDEPQRLLSLIETTFRIKSPEDEIGKRVYCLANGYSNYNPYFLFFGIQPDDTSKDGITVFRDRKRGKTMFLIEDVRADDFIRQKAETTFAAILERTDYGDFMLRNEALGDKCKNIGDFTDPKWKFREIYRIVLADTVYSVMSVADRNDKRKDERANIFIKKATTNTITPDTYDISREIIAGRNCIDAYPNDAIYYMIENAKKRGRFYFDSQKTANILSPYLT